MTKPPSLRRPGYAILALAAFALLSLVLWRGYGLYTARAQTLQRAQTSTATGAVYVANYIARTVDAADLLANEVDEYISEQGGIDRVSPAGLHQRLADLVEATSIQDTWWWSIETGARSPPPPARRPTSPSPIAPGSRP
jgi:hypothetical protein